MSTPTLALVTLLLLHSVSLCAQSNMYTLQLLSTDRGARCLDGSPPGFYIHKGTGQNSRKVVLYMDSGDFCQGFTLEQTLQSCYKRSKSSLGTTKNYPKQKSLDNLGLLSTDPLRNPVFHDWTKIFVIYCDGSIYTGSKTDPVSYKDTQLYFRGYNNVIELFRFMDEQYDFYNGDSIVLTGVSAGGMGTYFYSNYLYENTRKAKVYTIPDSGLFIADYYTPLAGARIIKEAAKPLMKLVYENISSFPIKQCAQDNKDDISECYTTSNLTKYFKAPMLMVQSPYDSFAIQKVVFSNCLRNQRSPPFSLENCNETARKVIEDYRGKIIEAIKQIKRDRKDVGVWGPSCSQHGFIDTDTFTDTNFRVPTGSGPMVHEAIQQFLDDPDNAPWYLDEVDWPLNVGCSGKKSFSLTVEPYSE